MRAADIIPRCPATPNCVSTLGRGRWFIEPYRFSESAVDAAQRLRAILRDFPGARITADDGRVIRAEFTTRIFHWVDDVVFVIDPQERRVDFRSASRTGSYDFGANRRRMEQIRQRFT